MEEGGFEELYFTGDSLARKSRRLGSRSLKGSFDLESPLVSEDPQNQPIVECVVTLWCCGRCLQLCL